MLLLHEPSLFSLVPSSSSYSSYHLHTYCVLCCGPYKLVCIAFVGLFLFCFTPPPPPAAAPVTLPSKRLFSSLSFRVICWCFFVLRNIRIVDVLYLIHYCTLLFFSVFSNANAHHTPPPLLLLLLRLLHTFQGVILNFLRIFFITSSYVVAIFVFRS